MPVQRDEPVQLIAQEQVRLFAELRKLPDAAWQRPSHYHGWSVARVVAHLALGGQFFHQSIGKAVRGDTLPPSLPGGQRMTADGFRTQLEQKQEQLAAKPRGEVLTLFDKTGSDMVDLLRKVPAHHMVRPAWHPDGGWTVAMFVSMRVFDLAFHGWDVRVAMDPAAIIRPQLQPFLVSLQLQVAKRRFKGGPELDAMYRFDLGSQSWTARAFGGKLEFGPPEPNPDATIKTDPNTFLLLSTARRPLAALEERGHLKLEGERDLALALLGVLFPTPER
ncbi:MAG: maleylpyruvate isomerase family mycothiol-dependent enzyme [Chloroflexota bacterium]